MAEIKVVVTTSRPTTTQLTERAAEVAALFTRYLPPLTSISGDIFAGGSRYLDLPSGLMPGFFYRFFTPGYVYLYKGENVVGTFCIHVTRIWVGEEKVLGLYYVAKHDEQRFLDTAVFSPTGWGTANIKGLLAPYLKPGLMR